jgi:hypothetical protein
LVQPRSWNPDVHGSPLFISGSRDHRRGAPITGPPWSGRPRSAQETQRAEESRNDFYEIAQGSVGRGARSRSRRASSDTRRTAFGKGRGEGLMREPRRRPAGPPFIPCVPARLGLRWTVPAVCASARR